MNPVPWHQPGGRLRMLRRADDLEDCAAEVAPVAGTMVAFRRSGSVVPTAITRIGASGGSYNCNWATEPSVVRREIARHRLVGPS